MKKLLMPLVVLMMAAMLSVVQYFVVTERYKDWKTTTAVITDIQTTDRRRHAGKWIHYYWNYNIDGVTYSGHDFFVYSEQKYKTGDEKEIWYNPDDHSESQFSKPSAELEVYIPFFLAVPISLGVYSTQSKKEKHY